MHVRFNKKAIQHWTTGFEFISLEGKIILKLLWKSWKPDDFFKYIYLFKEIQSKKFLIILKSEILYPSKNKQKRNHHCKIFHTKKSFSILLFSYSIQNNKKGYLFSDLSFFFVPAFIHDNKMSITLFANAFFCFV